MSSHPPFTLPPTILNLCTQIAEAVGRLSVLEEQSRSLHLLRWLHKTRTSTPVAYIPVESLVHQHQEGYYAAIRQSTAASDSSAFVLFMLERIREAIDSVATVQTTPQVSHHVTPQVATLLRTLKGKMSRDEIRTKLGLTDRKSFSKRYLQPALQQGLIAMTLPDKPRSRLQRCRLPAAGQAHGR